MSSNRWLIEGTLETETCLRIGNGDISEREDLYYLTDNGPEKVEISAFTIDSNKSAFIPGTTLKGKLRSIAEHLGISTLNQIFGSPDPDKEESVGGKVSFFDARISAVGVTEQESQNLAYWSEDRKTAVSAGVTISRKTRTASDKRLFHQEFVPQGVKFEFSMAGVDITEEELKDLLYVLEGLNREQIGSALGSSTGDGWGKVKWELTGLKTLEEAGVRDWISASMGAGSALAGWGILKEIAPAARTAYRDQARARAFPPANPSKATLEITLNFDGNFLVNDPSKTKKKGEKNDNDTRPNHSPLLTKNGKVLLPGSSIRGALRSQAERILRTLGGEHAACYPDGNGPRKACKAVYSIEEVEEKLCPACKVFGAPGWKSPVELTDFIPGSDGYLVDKQEFLAIDRFTGGGAEGLKFNATSLFKPALKGRFSVDLARLEKAGAGGWAIALLILTLRDLAEGDIRLGFGSAKGYGSLTATLKTMEIPKWEYIPKAFHDDLSSAKQEVEQFKWPGQLTDELILDVMIWLEKLAEISRYSQNKSIAE